MPWFEYGLMELADERVVKDHPDWVLAKANGERTMTMHGRHRMSWCEPGSPRGEGTLYSVGGGVTSEMRPRWPAIG